jgi:hypothetical protein
MKYTVGKKLKLTVSDPLFIITSPGHKGGLMKGIQYLVDDAGHKTAVVLDLAEWGELLEDIFDILVSEARRDEPTVSWEALQAEILAEETPESDLRG